MATTAEIRAERPSIVGPDAGPEPPFPLRLEGEIVKGFGRGSKELGIPTANIPIDGLAVGGRTDIDSGIYFGWAGLHAPSTIHRTSSRPDGSHHSSSAAPSSSSKAEDGSAAAKDPNHAEVYPMVMSVGWNPYYKNEKRSVEIHLIHSFAHDFYGAHIRLSILGFVRPELDYTSKEALIDDIRTDIRVSSASLEREAWRKYRDEEWLLGDD